MGAPASEDIHVGDVYRYPETGQIQFEGTVKTVTPRTVTTTDDFQEVTFTNVMGKLGAKFNTWYYWPTNTLVWSTNEAPRLTGTAGVKDTAYTNLASISSLSLYNTNSSHSGNR